MFKVRFITLLKSCYASKCFWDFPLGRLCLFSFLFVLWEHSVNTTYIWERKRRFPHSFCFSHQLLNGYSYQLICGTSQLKSPTSSFWTGCQTWISHLGEKCTSLLSMSVCSELISLLIIFSFVRQLLDTNWGMCRDWSLPSSGPVHGPTAWFSVLQCKM